MKLDLACGGNKKEGFTGVDISNNPEVDIVYDLNQYPWPFEDNSVDEIYCSHYIEHIPHDINNADSRDGLIQFMDEVYRILKPGAKAIFIAPYYSSERAWGDPTHRRAINDWTFYYYNKQWREEFNNLKHYNINSNFDAKISHFISNELSLKAKEVIDLKTRENLNAVSDIMAELTKI
jgi:SAM-dependent methyltransferase